MVDTGTSKHHTSVLVWSSSSHSTTTVTPCGEPSKHISHKDQAISISADAYPWRVGGHGQHSRVHVLLARDNGAGDAAAKRGAAVGVREREHDLGGSEEGVDRAGQRSSNLSYTNEEI